MRVLLDTCIWPGVRDILETSGHDVIWAGDWSPDPGDEEILEIANQDQRILITLDKDFGELAVLQGKPHHGIIRIVNFPVKEQGEIINHLFSRYQNDLQEKAIITADPKRVRIRKEAS